MASFRKRPNGTWRAELFVAGHRESGTFTTKAQAQAAQRETEMRQKRTTGIVAGKTVRDAFHRYEKEVSRTKRGHRFEALRMAVLAKIEVGDRNVKFGDIKPSDLTSGHVGLLRDARLKMEVPQRYVEGAPSPPVRTIKGSTVNREFNLLSHVFTIARREWKWISESPTKDVRRPKNPPRRDRRTSADEIERLYDRCRQ